ADVGGGRERVGARVTGVGGELLVVDNGSTDGTREALAGQADVRCVVEPTAGATRARNAALRAARGDVVAFIDDDATPAPGWLAALTAPFAQARGACGGGRGRLGCGGPAPPRGSRGRPPLFG